MNCGGRCRGPCRCSPPRALGATEIQCTGRYAHLINNGIGGTLDKPCANDWGVQLYCNQPDVTAWNSVAWDLFMRVRRSWNEAANQGIQVPPQVREYITNLEKDYCETGPDGTCAVYKLPSGSWWNINENVGAATAIARWCARAACALELLDNVRGIKPPVEDTPQHTPPWGGLGAAVGSLPMLALAAFAIWMISRRRGRGSW